MPNKQISKQAAPPGEENGAMQQKNKKKVGAWISGLQKRQLAENELSLWESSW